MRLNDYILMFVLAASITAGILLPEIGRVFSPYLTYFMMSLLFLSFLSISLDALERMFRDHWPKPAWLTCVKLLLLPLAVYGLFSLTAPKFALAAMYLFPFFGVIISLRLYRGLRENGRNAP